MKTLNVPLRCGHEGCSKTGTYKSIVKHRREKEHYRSQTNPNFVVLFVPPPPKPTKPKKQSIISHSSYIENAIAEEEGRSV